MKTCSSIFPWSIIWILVAVELVSCDTTRNIEDPELNYFVKYYGQDGDQTGVDMELLSDGSLLLLGNSLQGSFNSDVYLVHVDAEGQVIWEKTFGTGPNGQGSISAKDLERTNDGNFVILADYRNVLGDFTQVKLLKVSDEGDLLDSAVNIGTEGNEFSRSVTLLDDGGFIVTGTTDFTSTFKTVNNPDPDLGDFFNYRLDQNLDVFGINEWFPVSPGFGGKLDVAVRAFQTTDGYYVFGYSNINLNATNPDKRIGFVYFKRDAAGGGQQDPFFPGNAPNKDTEIQSVNSVDPALGGGFIVTGKTTDNFDVSEIFIAKMRSNLNFTSADITSVLYRTLPLGRNLRGVAVTSSIVGTQGYLVTGNEIRSTGASNIWLSKIDQSGSILWSSTFGSETHDDTAAAVIELSDGKIVILGTMGLADNQSKMALIKVNTSGQLLK